MISPQQDWDPHKAADGGVDQDPFGHDREVRRVEYQDRVHRAARHVLLGGTRLVNPDALAPLQPQLDHPVRLVPHDDQPVGVEVKVHRGRHVNGPDRYR